ncbi:MAG: type IV secretion system protein VirB10 [Phenylobacterium sp.]|uniref:type IV secretion system protein VirB10 n=1 Tax=Phenylobacterium sp. TaxID=1871053 RepID=UPI002735BB1A|nr:type IV secretion system protein VirB10 [Phenylobacterium sp.]MDP3749300.1 type IV secretion system protein VirB10 [Phenylobacterium sp.]
MSDGLDSSSRPGPPASGVIAGERTITPISGRLGAAVGGKTMTLAALAAGCAVFLVLTWDRGDRAAPKRLEPARQVVAFEPARGGAAPTLANPGPDAPSLSGEVDGVPALDPYAGETGRVPSRARPTSRTPPASPLVVYSSGVERIGPAPAPRPVLAAAAAPTELDALRQASDVGLVRAGRVGDRNFLILAGASLPCVLTTALDSTTPGFVSCLMPSDVLSDNGAVVLMEKGSRVLGEYRSRMAQGQTRIFVVWTRAVTPSGVSVALASPAADALGRAGFDGEVDTRFWSRFGGALLMSVVDDGSEAAFGRDRRERSFREAQGAATEALRSSADIPPRLRKAQGAEVSIFVAHDLDFSAVYGLRSR